MELKTLDSADNVLFCLQGIEALEFWLDPDPATQTESAPAPDDSSAPLSADQDEDQTQPKVFCQKGKCYPYDPARMKNPNINLEMKPGEESQHCMSIK